MSKLAERLLTWGENALERISAKIEGMWDQEAGKFEEHIFGRDPETGQFRENPYFLIQSPVLLRWLQEIGFDGMDILDLGSGPGTVSVDILENLGKIPAPGSLTLVDISRNMIKLAEQNILKVIGNHLVAAAEFNPTVAVDTIQGIKLDYHHTPAEDLSKIPDESLDVIVCNNVLNNVEDADKVIAECRRVLRYGGQLIVSVASEDRCADYATGDPQSDDWEEGPYLEEWKGVEHPVWSFYRRPFSWLKLFNKHHFRMEAVDTPRPNLKLYPNFPTDHPKMWEDYQRRSSVTMYRFTKNGGKTETAGNEPKAVKVKPN